MSYILSLKITTKEINTYSEDFGKRELLFRPILRIGEKRSSFYDFKLHYAGEKPGKIIGWKARET